MDRHGRDVELPSQCALVQALYVLKLMHVREPFGVDLPLGEGVKHERVVGVRTMRDVDDHGVEGGRPQRLRAAASAESISVWCSVYSGSCFARSAGAAAVSLFA